MPQTWRLCKDQKVVREPGGYVRAQRSSGNPEVLLDPEITFGDPEVVGEPGGSPLDPEIIFGTRRFYGNPEVLEIVIGP